MAEKYLNLVGNIESITKNGVGVINNFPITFQAAVWDFVKKHSLPIRRSEDDDRGNRLIRIDVFCTQEGAEAIKEGVARFCLIMQQHLGWRKDQMVSIISSKTKFLFYFYLYN